MTAATPGRGRVRAPQGASTPPDDALPTPTPPLRPPLRTHSVGACRRVGAQVRRTGRREAVRRARPSGCGAGRARGEASACTAHRCAGAWGFADDAPLEPATLSHSTVKSNGRTRACPRAAGVRGRAKASVANARALGTADGCVGRWRGRVREPGERCLLGERDSARSRRSGTLRRYAAFCRWGLLAMIIPARGRTSHGSRVHTHGCHVPKMTMRVRQPTGKLPTASQRILNTTLAALVLLTAWAISNPICSNLTHHSTRVLRSTYARTRDCETTETIKSQTLNTRALNECGCCRAEHFTT